MPKATASPETTATEASATFVAEPEQTTEQTAQTETERKLALLEIIIKQSADVVYENVGTNGVDGEMYVALRITPQAYESLRSLVVTLRTEYQKTL